MILRDHVGSLPFKSSLIKALESSENPNFEMFNAAQFGLEIREAEMKERISLFNELPLSEFEFKLIPIFEVVNSEESEDKVLPKISSIHVEDSSDQTINLNQNDSLVENNLPQRISEKVVNENNGSEEDLD